MSNVVIILMIVAGLLLVISLMQPLADRLRLPHTVLLAGLGMALGVLALIGEAPHDASRELGPLASPAMLFAEVEISSQVILTLFLPILLFQTGLTIDVRRMLDDIAPVLVMAVVAVLVCTLAVGFALWGASEEALVACLLLGAIVATTDPVAVVGIFREVGAPRRLSILIEGESVFNDAAAIALFVVFLSTLVTGRELSWLGAAWLFLRGFLGGALLGLVTARLAVLAMATLRNRPLAETSVTLALAYLVFVVGERYFAVSGVVAVVTAALVVGSTGRVRMTPDSWAQLEGVWNQLGFWASSLIFIFASMLIPRFLIRRCRGEAPAAARGHPRRGSAPGRGGRRARPRRARRRTSRPRPAGRAERTRHRDGEGARRRPHAGGDRRAVAGRGQGRARQAARRPAPAGDRVRARGPGRGRGRGGDRRAADP